MDFLTGENDELDGEKDELDGEIDDTGATGATDDTGATGEEGATDKEGEEGPLKEPADNKKKPAKEWNDTESWVSFVKSLFIYFIITLLVGLFGSSFIYLTTRGSELDIILPTDNEFYNAKTYQIQKKGAYNIVECNETPSGSFSVFEDNFPYNLIKFKDTPTKEQLKSLTLVDRLLNWFAKCVAGSFKQNRFLLKYVLNGFVPDGPLGNHAFQMLIAAPFIVLAGGLIAPFTGWGSAFGAGIASDVKVTVWGGFLLYAWGLFGGIAGLIWLRFITTICFYPMSQNWKEVSNIMACNVKVLVCLFGFFVCGAAYETLDPTLAGIMGIVYLCLVAWTIFKYFKAQIM